MTQYTYAMYSVSLQLTHVFSPISIWVLITLYNPPWQFLDISLQYGKPLSCLTTEYSTSKLEPLESKGPAAALSFLQPSTHSYVIN